MPHYELGNICEIKKKPFIAVRKSRINCLINFTYFNKDLISMARQVNSQTHQSVKQGHVQGKFQRCEHFQFYSRNTLTINFTFSNIQNTNLSLAYSRFHRIDSMCLTS